MQRNHEDLCPPRITKKNLHKHISTVKTDFFLTFYTFTIFTIIHPAQQLPQSPAQIEPHHSQVSQGKTAQLLRATLNIIEGCTTETTLYHLPRPIQQIAKKTVMPRRKTVEVLKIVSCKLLTIFMGNCSICYHTSILCS